MRCWEVELELGGRTYTVPALPAVEWWPILVGLDLLAVLDLTGHSEEIDDRLISGELGYAELTEPLRDSLEAVAGRSLHSAYALAATADQNWSAVNGDLARLGFRWDEQSLSAALDAIYATVLRTFQKQEDLDAWLRILDDESLTAPGKKRTAAQTVKDEFATMAGPRPTGGVRSTGVRSGSAPTRTRSQPRPPRQPGPSGEPMPPPSPPAGSDRPASSEIPGGEDEPASGTGPPLPQPAR